jgi:DNA (cytosine-5)-methyltransferase 1
MKHTLAFDLTAEGQEINYLNLYSGIGGNRKLLPENVHVTAIEFEQYIADAYREMYPNDEVIVTDAHEFLLQNHMKYNFVWGSPPCPTHSKASTSLVGYGIYRYPDMRLYQEIIFLDNFFKGKWVIENVIPYYKPLIEPTIEIDRHLFWSNFSITDFSIERNYNVNRATKEILAEHHGIILPEKTKDKRKLLRNAVTPLVGLHVFNCAVGAVKSNALTQTELWNTTL